MSYWQERSRPNDLQIMLPQLLLSLDRIRDQAMPPERRLARLRSIKDQVEAIQKGQLAGGLSPQSVVSDAVAHELTLEQRLGRTWCNNLQRLLVEMGQPRYQGNARFAVYREWTLRQLVRGYSRVVEGAVVAGLPAPMGVWRSLHELFLYLEGRDELDGPAIPVYQRLRPGDAYKRLLLIGSLEEFAKAERIYREIGPGLRDWAAASDLTRTQSGIGDSRALQVDLGADRPPTRFRAEQCEASNVWVLRPPREFCEALQYYSLRDTTQLEPA
jgi:hypothetical protein